MLPHSLPGIPKTSIVILKGTLRTVKGIPHSPLSNLLLKAATNTNSAAVDEKIKNYQRTIPRHSLIKPVVISPDAGTLFLSHVPISSHVFFSFSSDWMLREPPRRRCLQINIFEESEEESIVFVYISFISPSHGN